MHYEPVKCIDETICGKIGLLSYKLYRTIGECWWYWDTGNVVTVFIDPICIPTEDVNIMKEDMLSLHLSPHQGVLLVALLPMMQLDLESKPEHKTNDLLMKLFVNTLTSFNTIMKAFNSHLISQLLGIIKFKELIHKS